MTDREDLPKVVATIMWESPGFVLRGGFAYLKMKRMARKSSQRFMNGLIKGGMSPELAQRLSDKYAVELRISAMVSKLGIMK